MQWHRAEMRERLGNPKNKYNCSQKIKNQMKCALAKVREREKGEIECGEPSTLIDSKLV